MGLVELLLRWQATLMNREEERGNGSYIPGHTPISRDCKDLHSKSSLTTGCRYNRLII